MSMRLSTQHPARILCGILPLLYSLPSAANTSLDSCLLKAMQDADSSATVGELRARCQAREGDLPMTGDSVAPATAGAAAAGAATEPTGIQQRLALEQTLDENP